MTFSRWVSLDYLNIITIYTLKNARTVTPEGLFL